MLFHDDVVYQILLWLPVISLLRFKLVCRTWRALIESNEFIKQHLHHHHYDPNLKDKNHSLIDIGEGKENSPFIFPLISIDSFEDPNACVQLNISDLREYFPLDVEDTVSYNGIVCFSFRNCKREYGICLWNPATRQSRVLPQSPPFTPKMKHFHLVTRLGFGFEVKNNDYKVVSLCQNSHLNEERVEVYSLNTDSWRSVVTVFPFKGRLRNPRAPFNNGTCFFWYALDYESESAMILSFDFSSEKFCSISFPNVGSRVSTVQYACVISDKIACVCDTEDSEKEIWVFEEYGSVNESWVKLYKIDLYSIDGRKSMQWHSMNGNYLYFTAIGWICSYSVVTKMACGYNVVTKEIKNLSTVEICDRTHCEKWNSYGLRTRYYGSENLVDFKESLLSVGNGSKENDNQVNL